MKGHGLVGEGKPHNASGADTSRYYGGVGGTGYGKCACGALSPEPLPSGGARKRWHREHKAEVGAR